MARTNPTNWGVFEARGLKVRGLTFVGFRVWGCFLLFRLWCSGSLFVLSWVMVWASELACAALKPSQSVASPNPVVSKPPRKLRMRVHFKAHVSCLRSLYSAVSPKCFVLHSRKCTPAWPELEVRRIVLFGRGTNPRVVEVTPMYITAWVPQ